MKILLVITHGNMGGATNVVYELARGLRAHGDDVTVGFGEGAYLDKKLKDARIPLHHFKHLRRTSNPFAPLFFANEMKRFMLSTNAPFDAVQFNSTNALPGCRGVKMANRKTKTIFTFHGLSVLDKNYQTFFLLKWAYWLFFTFFLSYTNSPVFVSQNDFAEAKRIGLVKDGRVIYNGLDESSLKFLTRDAARAAIEKQIAKATKTNYTLGDAFIVGSIGRLSYQKNYEFLISAFPDILTIQPNAIAVVIGDGPKRAEYERQIATLGLKEKCFILGEIPDASHYLKAFDLFVLPSRYEGLPVTLTECLFAGTPVIASAVGGNGEIAPSPSLYPWDNQEAFLKACDGAIKNPKAFVPDPAHSKRFTVGEMVKAYEAIIPSRDGH